MKAIEITIEIMLLDEKRVEYVTYKQITVKSAVSKITKEYPNALILNLSANHFNS